MKYLVSWQVSDLRLLMLEPLSLSFDSRRPGPYGSGGDLELNKHACPTQDRESLEEGSS